MRLGFGAGPTRAAGDDDVEREREEEVAQPATPAASAARNSRRRMGMRGKHRRARKVLDRRSPPPTSSRREGTMSRWGWMALAGLIGGRVWSCDADGQRAERLGDADGLRQRDRPAIHQSIGGRSPGDALQLGPRVEHAAAGAAAGERDLDGADGGSAAAGRADAAARRGAGCDAAEHDAARHGRGATVGDAAAAVAGATCALL